MFKKIILASILVLLPSIALGASYISFSSQTVSYKAGQVFSVPVYVGSSDGDKIYTAKVSLSYNPEYVEVTSFTFKEGSLPLAQPGYDKTDNVNGTLIKTAGYTGGISSQTLFGTVTFKSKKAGSTNISVSSDSQLLNGTNQNVLTSKGTLVVVLGEVQQKVEGIENPTANTTEKTKTISQTEVKETPETEDDVVGESIEVPEKMNPVFLAALSLFAGINPIAFIVVALICMLGVYYLLRKK